MKPAVTQENDDISMFFARFEPGWSASKDLSWRPWLFLRNDDFFKSFFLKCFFWEEQRVIELNRPQNVEGFLLEVWEVEDDGLDEVIKVDLDLDKDVEHFSSCLCDGDQTGVTIVD